MEKSNDIFMNDFYEYFANMNKHENVSENFIDENIINNSDNCIFDVLDKQFTLDEIKNNVQSLKRNKSFGSDLLLNEYFMETFDVLGGHLLDIFNAILYTGIYPEIWTKGTIIPIFKKVIQMMYVVLVSCFSKNFTGILNNRIKAVIDDHYLLSDAQYGFRPQRYTVDAIFVLHSLVNKIINKKERLYCAFIDLKSAFDKVKRNGLWSKLYNLGIKGKFLRVIKICIHLSNHVSEIVIIILNTLNVRLD